MLYIFVVKKCKVSKRKTSVYKGEVVDCAAGGVSVGECEAVVCVVCAGVGYHVVSDEGSAPSVLGLERSLLELFGLESC